MDLMLSREGQADNRNHNERLRISFIKDHSTMSA